MIKKIKVKNFALIEDIEIEFEKGLTVLTGETGAGKSIILDALSLLFGKRSDFQMIRHGMKKAEVFGVFEISDEIAKAFNLTREIEVLREVDLNGKHKVLLNGKNISLNYLKSLMEKVGNIHFQNESLAILEQNEYLKFIDFMDLNLISQLLNKYLILRNNYFEEKKHFEKIKNERNLDLKQKEFFQYQLKELKELNLKPNELEELNIKFEKLKHFDKISENLRQVNYIFAEKIDFSQIYDSAKIIEKIANFDQDYPTVVEKLLSSYYEISDIKEIIKQKIDELDYDEDEFNLIQDRIYDLNKIEKKYERKIDDLFNYMQEIDEKISLINNYDDYIEKYEKKLNESFMKAFIQGKKISDIRKKLALKLEKKLVEELAELNLENAKIKIEFKTLSEKDLNLYENGIDIINFLVSLNEGEPLKELKRVSSGGEQARFMFCLKAIYAQINKISLLVLDEIDIGISGKTASMVAKKMQKLSNNLQLIVISHLPQVAAKANFHYGIKKHLRENRMITEIKRLNYDERVEMIASMLSDESLSDFAINQAKNLLK